MNIQNNDATPAISQYWVWHPITKTLNSLNCWYLLLYKRGLQSVHSSHSPFHTKCVFSCWCGATALPSDLLHSQTKTNSVALSPRANYTDWATAPALPLNLSYILFVLSQVTWRNLFHNNSNIPP
jgi:hypothetical protein